MKRKHAIAISALLALAGIVGTVALAKTVALGQSSSTPTASELHARAARLERAEAQLRSARDLMPPELPPLPTTPLAAAAQSKATLVHEDTAFAPERGDDDEEHEDEHEDEDGYDVDDHDEHEREYADD